MAKHKIALIPGDGIGKEVLPEGVRVLEAAARRFNFQLEFTDFDWSCDRLLQTGKMMPDDGMEQLKQFESIFLGAVGWPGVRIRKRSSRPIRFARVIRTSTRTRRESTADPDPPRL